MNPKVVLASALALATMGHKLFNGGHAVGRASQDLNLGEIMYARKHNQRNKNQKRLRGGNKR
jgi:hypothetical protein